MKSGIGIEIGGTKLQVGLGGADGTVVKRLRETVDPARGGDGIRCALEDLVPCLIAETGGQMSDLAGIGIGFGGPVDSKRGVTLVSHQVEGWDSFPLKEWAEKRWSLPVKIQNDASLAGYAEAVAGAGRGCDRVFYMTIGSGIGGGLISDGIIEEGQGLGAAEIGHNWVPDPWTGKPDKLEHVCSGWAIGRRARQRIMDGHGSSMPLLVENDLERITAETVYQAADQGDSLALTILAETCDTLGIAISNVIALLHPDKVVIGGGVSLMGKLFWEPLLEAVAYRVFGPFRDSWSVVPAALSEDVVLVGGILLAFS